MDEHTKANQLRIRSNNHSLQYIPTQLSTAFVFNCWLEVIISPVSSKRQLENKNKANLRDLIAATGLINFFKFDSNRIFFGPCDLEFDGWPRKTIAHLFYTTLSFVHHFKAISEFKLELQSGNAQFGSKSTNFSAVWPSNLTDDLEKTIGHLFYATSNFVHYSVTIWDFKLELQSGNPQFG